MRASLATLRRLASVALLVLIADAVALPLVGTETSSSGTPAPVSTSSGAKGKRPKPVGVWPLTGLPAYSTATLDRPAVSIKIDNAPDARPQFAIDSADIVTEELVEGGLTRLMATYQSHDAAVIGPVRSARPEDPTLLRNFGGGIFAFSGASTAVLAAVQANSGALLVTPLAGDTTFGHLAGRRPPTDLSVSTQALYALGARHGVKGPPPPVFLFATPTPPGSPIVTRARLVFSGSASAEWDWEPFSATYMRKQNGTPDVQSNGGPITANNIVILSVPVVASGNYDVLHNPTPLEVLTGSGPCWVLRQGVMIAGRWQRSSPSAPLDLVAADGSPIALHVGRTWLELLPQPSQPRFN